MSTNEQAYTFSQAQLQQLAEIIEKRLDENKQALANKAEGMADKLNYLNLMEVCYAETEAYLCNTANLKTVLTDPSNIKVAFDSIAERDEFKSLMSEEYKGFPRIVLMTVLAGSEAMAAHEAWQNLKDLPAEEADRLNSLADIYHKYMEDAIAYGNGENKTVSFTGNQQ